MSRIVITVVGKDRVGIVATISNAIAKSGANIEDLTSSRLEDQFVMLIVCSMGKAKSFGALKNAVTSAGAKAKMSVVVQREEIFKAMHRV